MNRYLLVPGLVSVVAFVCICSMGSSWTTMPFVPSEESPMMEVHVRNVVLDGWPQDSSYSYGSRSAPEKNLYVRLGELARNESGSQYTTTFSIVALSPEDRRYKTQEFPMRIDRFTGLISILEDDQWQDYANWLAENQRGFIEAAGFEYAG